MERERSIHYKAEEIEEKAEQLFEIEKLLENLDRGAAVEEIANLIENPEIAGELVNVAIGIMAEHDVGDQKVISDFLEAEGIDAIPKEPMKRHRLLMAIIVLILSNIIGVGCAMSADEYYENGPPVVDVDMKSTLEPGLWRSEGNRAIEVIEEDNGNIQESTNMWEVYHIDEAEQVKWEAIAIDATRANMIRGIGFTPESFAPYIEGVENPNRFIGNIFTINDEETLERFNLYKQNKDSGYSHELSLVSVLYSDALRECESRLESLGFDAKEMLKKNLLGELAIRKIFRKVD